MRRIRALGATLALVLASAACGGGEPEPSEQEAATNPADTVPLILQPRRLTDTAPPLYRARFETSVGAFVVEVHRDWSPRGADRFWNLIRAGYYDSVYFHRVTPRIAQFGFHPDPRINALWLPRYIGDDPLVQSNTRGRVSFAHAGMNTRSTQIFINKMDNLPYDDGKFAPFAEVVEGMDVVDRLYDGYGEMPPDGNGPSPGQAAYRGNAYFEEEFPELTQILTITVVDGPASP